MVLGVTELTSCDDESNLCFQSRLRSNFGGSSAVTKSLFRPYLQLHQYFSNRPENSRNRQEIIELVYPALIFCNNERNLWFSVISE